jgi:hypothetical protein
VRKSDVRFPHSEEMTIVYVDLLGYSAILGGKKFYSWGITEPPIERSWDFIKRFYEITDHVFGETSEETPVFGFSDGIFVILRCSSGEENIDIAQLSILLGKLQELLDECLKANLPLRGGISIGQCIPSPSLGFSGTNYLAGRVVQEAISFEKIQEWAGIAFFPPDWIKNDKKRYCKILTELQSYEQCPIERWDVPTKKGLVNTYVIAPKERSIEKLKEFMDFELKEGTYEDGKYRSSLRFLDNQSEEGGPSDPCQE